MNRQGKLSSPRSTLRAHEVIEVELIGLLFHWSQRSHKWKRDSKLYISILAPSEADVEGRCQCRNKRDVDSSLNLHTRMGLTGLGFEYTSVTFTRCIFLQCSRPQHHFYLCRPHGTSSKNKRAISMACLRAHDCACFTCPYSNDDQVSPSLRLLGHIQAILQFWTRLCNRTLKKLYHNFWSFSSSAHHQ